MGFRQHPGHPARLRPFAGRGRVPAHRFHLRSCTRQHPHALRHYRREQPLCLRLQCLRGHAVPHGRQHRHADGRNRHQHPDRRHPGSRPTPCHGRHTAFRGRLARRKHRSNHVIKRIISPFLLTY